MKRTLVMAGLIFAAGALPALAQSPVCGGEGKIKSAVTELETNLTFQNNGRSTYQIYWINYEGVRVHYGDIAPGTSHSQPTHLGNAWMITNNGANCEGFFFAETNPRTISLGGNLAVSGPIGGQAAGAPPRGGALPRGPALPRAGGQLPQNSNNNANNFPANQGSGQNQPQPQYDDPAPVRAADGNPCVDGEYWNKSKDVCIDTATKTSRDPNAQRANTRNTNNSASQNSGGKTMRCRPGYVQSGSKCVQDDGSRSNNVQPQNNNGGRTMRCRPGFVQQGSKCVRGSASNSSGGNTGNLCRSGFERSGNRCVRIAAVRNNVVADLNDGTNRPNNLCGPGFTDNGGGCISNALLPENQ